MIFQNYGFFVILLFSILVFVYGQTTNFYVSPNGKPCDRGKKYFCESETEPCLLNCTFTLDRFFEAPKVVIKLYPGKYHIMEMLVLEGGYSLGILSVNNQKIVIEPLYSDKTNKSIFILGDHEVVNYGVTIFQINTLNIDIKLRGFEIINVGYLSLSTMKTFIFGKYFMKDTVDVGWKISLEDMLIDGLHTVARRASSVNIVSSEFIRIKALVEILVIATTDHTIKIHDSIFRNSSFDNYFLFVHDNGRWQSPSDKRVLVDIWRSKFIGIFGLDWSVIYLSVPNSKLELSLRETIFDSNQVSSLWVECVSSANISVDSSIFTNISYRLDASDYGIVSGTFVYPNNEESNFLFSINNCTFSYNEVVEIIMLYTDVTYVQYKSNDDTVIYSPPFLKITNCTLKNNEVWKNLVSITPQGFTYVPAQMQLIFLALHILSTRFISNNVASSNVLVYRFGEVQYDYSSFVIAAPSAAIGMIVDDSLFRDSNGSGVYTSGVYTIIKNSKFVRNGDSAVSIINSGLAHWGYSTISDCFFISNRAQKNGGGVFTENNHVNILNSYFKDNEAVLGGGAISVGVSWEESGGKISLSGVTLEENHSPFGGGIWLSTRNSLCVGSFGDEDYTEKIQLILNNNHATSAGGAIYVNEPAEYLIKDGECLNTDAISFSENYIVDETDNTNRVQNNILTSPYEVSVVSETIHCNEFIGKNFWYCSLASFWVVDYFGTRITTPTYEENLLIMTVDLKNNERLSSSLSTKHRPFSPDSEHVEFFVDYNKMKHKKVEMEVSFLGTTYPTYLKLHTKSFGPTYLALYSSLGAVGLVFMFAIALSAFCCCFGCLIAILFSFFFCCCVQFYMSEKKQRIVLAEREFSNYVEYLSGDSLLEPINIESGRSINDENEGESEDLENDGEGNDIDNRKSRSWNKRNDINEKSRLLRNPKMKRSDSDLLRRSKRYVKDIDDVHRRIGPYHIFFGNPNGKGSVFYVERPSFWISTQKTLYYPVFSGHFKDGEKNGEGTEYFYVYGNGMKDFHVWRNMAWEEKGYKFVKQWSGSYLNNIKHGFGTEYQLTRDGWSGEMLKGKWTNGQLTRIFNIEYPLRIINFETDIVFGEQVGKGGFSTVYRAFYQKKQDVAVKIFDPEGKYNRSPQNTSKRPKRNPTFDMSGFSIHQKNPMHVRTCEEIGAILKRIKMFNHPNIVQIIGWTGPKFTMYEFGYVMELATCSVREFFKKELIISLELKDKILLDCALGMECFHDQCGLIHRDLKLGNLLMSTTDPLTMNIKICDFNVGMRDFAKEKKFESAAGSPFNCSPESFSENFDYKCDVYSFGIMMYEVFFDKVDDPYGILETERCPVCDEEIDLENLLEEMIKHHEHYLRPSLFGKKSKIVSQQQQDETLDLEMDNEEEEEEDGEEEEEEDGEKRIKKLSSRKKNRNNILTPNNWRVKLMKSCWSEVPSERPGFKEIVKQFKMNIII